MLDILSTIQIGCRATEPLYLYRRLSSSYASWPSLSMVVVQNKLPQTEPCMTMFFMSIRFDKPFEVFMATLAFWFSRKRRGSLSLSSPASNMSLMHSSIQSASKHFSTSNNCTSIGSSLPFMTEFVTDKNVVPNVSSFSGSNITVCEVGVNCMILIIVNETIKDASEDGDPEDSSINVKIIS